MEQSKREALLHAQESLCDFAGGVYDNVHYWAAFVLLDALD